MINLIPPDAQIEVKREYWLRVFSVWAFLIGSAFGVVALLFIPVYVLLESQLTVFQQEYIQANDKSGLFADAETAIKNTNAVSKLLTETDAKILFSKIIEEIESNTAEGISIESFSVATKDNQISSIGITGEANTRFDLSSFREALEKSPLFRTATLPLSNFAKDKDIPFSISVTPSTGS